MTLELKSRIVNPRFPIVIDRYLNPSPTDDLENPVDGLDHHLQHGQINDSLNALEKKVGIDGSEDTTSLDYLLKQGVDPGHTHSSTGGGGAARHLFNPNELKPGGTYAVPSVSNSYQMQAMTYANSLDSDTDNYTMFAFDLSDWDGTSDVTIHLWHSTNSAGDIRFGLHHKGLNNEAPNTAFTLQYATFASYTNVTKSSFVLSGGLSAGDMVGMVMPRYGANAADTCGGVFWVWLVIVEYNNS